MGKLKSREKILESARELFRANGYAATSMQAIADHAGINKGLLHYYFKSKHAIFREIFLEAFRSLLPRVDHILNGDLPLKEKIEAFAAEYIDMLLQEPEVPGFIINELNTNKAEFMAQVMSDELRPNPMGFFAQIEMEVRAGHIRPISPINLILNMVSMCVFPFAARPLIQGLFAIHDSQFRDLMEARKQDVAAFIWQSIALNHKD